MRLPHSILLVILIPSLAWGLTIYRIGGNPDYAHPLADSTGVGIVKLTWEEFAQDPKLEAHGVRASPEGRLMPVFVNPDENLSLGAIERGEGKKFYPEQRFGSSDGAGPRGHKYGTIAKNDFTNWTVDGDPTTYMWPSDLLSDRLNPKLVMFLGATFPVNRVVVYPRPDHPERYIEDYTLYSWREGQVMGLSRNSGDGQILARGRENRDPVIDMKFPTVVIDRLMFNVDNFNEPYMANRMWEIAEFEIYGEGYVPRGLYLSKALELDAVSSLGEIRFFGFKDRDAKLRIRTRSGSDEDPERYWRLTGRGDEKSFLKANGQPLTLSDYNSLQGGKGGITTDLDNWSFWSGPYDLADSLGAPITSPSPRQFFQLQLEFLPQGIDGAGVDFIEFHITQPPVAGRVIGEIWPIEVAPGQETPFVYAMLPTFSGGEGGFDRIVLETTGQFTRVDSFRINEERLEDGEWELLAPLEDQRLELSLPRIDRAKSGRLVEVFFQGRAFRFGTIFSGQVFDGQRPLEVGQFVEDGDATFRLDSNQRSVGIALNGNIINKVAANPRVMTPNDDGINDQVRIEYTLLELAGVGEVQVSIFDLAGRQVRQVYQGENSSGQHAQLWDGLDEDDQVVAPGIYLYRVHVDTDAGQEERSGLVAVVF